VSDTTTQDGTTQQIKTTATALAPISLPKSQQFQPIPARKMKSVKIIIFMQQTVTTGHAQSPHHLLRLLAREGGKGVKRMEIPPCNFRSSRPINRHER
jgi:hypothetical protein